MRAILFPGQGSQYIGMGADFFNRFTSTKKIFETADKTLGFSLTDIILNGPDEKLKMTKNTQPAIMIVGVSIFNVLNKEYGLGFKPLKSFEKLPGILREGTVGEGIALSQALSSPPDPYIQGSSDMSGAISSLSQNEERLYSNMNMTDFTNGSMSQVPSPSTMRNPLQSYINNIQNAGYIYDSTLLAVKPSAIVPS